MSSISKTQKRSKKANRLGPVQVIRPEQDEAFDVDRKLECIRALIPLGLMHNQEGLEEEVCTLADARSVGKTPGLPGRRHGSIPGSVQLAGQQPYTPVSDFVEYVWPSSAPFTERKYTAEDFTYHQRFSVQ